MNPLFRAGMACAMVLAASCSDSSSDSKPATDPTEIGADGGTVSADGASVNVPKGALEAGVKIAVAESDVSVEPPEGYVLAGPPIAFTPHGTTFAEAVTLTLPYTSSSELLAVLRLDDEDDETWEVVEGGEFARGEATLDVTSFSIYAVAEEAGESGSGGAGGMSSSEDTAGGPSSGGASDSAGAPGTGGAPGGAGDVMFSCDRANTDGNGLRICTDYFYPAMVVELLGDNFMKACPGPGDGVLGDACDTSGAVVGCLAKDADGIPGLNVTNWFYMGTKDEIINGVICTEDGVEVVDPP